MLQKIQNKLLPSSRIAVGIVAAVLFVLGVLQVAQGLIDTHNYRDQFIQIVKEKTGKTIVINGKVSISLLPTPTIYIPGVVLRDSESANPIPSLTVDMIRLDVPLAAVFSDRPSVTSITLEQPVLEVERAHDNLIHWDWLNAALLKPLAGDNQGDSPSLTIHDGKILYHDSRSDKGIALEKFAASVALGNHLTAKGSFATLGHDISFNLATAPAAGASVPFNIQLQAKKDMLKWDGTVDFTADVPKLAGKFELALENSLAWANAAPNAPAINTAALPFKLSGEWKQDGLSIDMANLALDGLNSIGNGNVSLRWKEWQPLVTADMHFKTIDYNAWQKMFANPPSENNQASGFSSAAPENPLPQDMQANLAITADQVNYGAQIWQNTNLSAALAGGSLTVNQFNVKLPGDSTLTLFGTLSQGATNSGMRFEGSMETAGKSLRQALTAFNESAIGLPEIGFGVFSARSNIFVSAEQLRLSEADVKLNDLALRGGLVAYFDAHPRLEADVRLKDINFDYFRNVWRATNAGAAAPPQNVNFNWLKNLQTSIDFKVNVDGFTFMERKGNAASFRMFAKQGEFGLYDVRLTYPEETMSSNITLNVAGEQPLAHVALTAATIDLGYFTTTPAPAAPATDATGKKIWPQSLIDTSWIQGYNGDFDISIGKLTYGKNVLNKLKFQARLDNNVLAFKTFTFDYWQGACSLAGSVFGGEVPGASLSFTLYALDMHDMLKDLINRENITGKASISGTLSTAGVNFLSWVSQADVKLIMAARGVNVSGLNLQGVMDATGVSRTAADVFNNVNHALVNGATELTVDGNINMQNGVMKTPGITLKYGNTLGDLTGEVRLLPWTMDVSALFQFPSLSSETVPTLTVQLSGPIEAPELKTDTSSLEAYVAKRIVIK